MRPLPVVMPEPTRASLLLSLHRPLGINSHFGLVNPMELLMRAILARPPGCDELHLYSQLHPPRAQTRQPCRPSAAKRCPVVTTNTLRHTMLFENARKLPARLPH